MSNNTPAPAGSVYVCLACGKTSPTKSGWTEDNHYVGERGWDVSCFLNCTLVTIAELEKLRNEAHGN